MELELEAKLEQRVDVEEELSVAREALESAEHLMRTMDQQRMDREHAIEAARAGLEDVRMLAQELKVRRETLQEQFATTGLELATVYREMPPKPTCTPGKKH